MSGLLEVVALSAALVALVAWLITILFTSARAMQGPSLVPRAALARWGLYAPLWAPLVVLTAALSPGLLGALLGFGDHCMTHGASHHHHLCALHPPHISRQPIALILIAAIFGPALLASAHAAAASLRQSRLAAALVRSSQTCSLGADIRLLDCEDPIALTVGVWRPVILLSTGLLEAVSPNTLRIIVAHERAHVRRRDMAWALCDALVAVWLPGGVRRSVLRDLALAREQACDLDAARAHCEKGRVQVAAALTEVVRLGLKRQPFGMSVGASSLEARVRRLLDPHASPPSRAERALPVVCVVALAGLGAGPIHNLLERIVTHLLH